MAMKCPLCQQEIVRHPDVSPDARCTICERELSLKEDRSSGEDRPKSPHGFPAP